MALSDEKLQKGLIMGCGMIHAFKAGSGCGLNVDGIFISLTFGSSLAAGLL